MKLKSLNLLKLNLQKRNLKTNDQYDAEVLAAEVAKDSEMKYYAAEDSRGKAELIKSALKFIKEEIPATVKFSDFQKLVESNL